jgi:hypothetical protein
MRIQQETAWHDILLFVREGFGSIHDIRCPLMLYPNLFDLIN